LLVVDASAALWVCGHSHGFDRLGEDLVAPHLMWSEAAAALRAWAYRGAVSDEVALDHLDRVESSPIARRDHPDLRREAWRIAKGFGWKRTYDAEYVALAMLLDARVVTADGRLRRGTDRLRLVIGVDEV
jgi:predicted nucleic acid-binding protein